MDENQQEPVQEPTPEPIAPPAPGAPLQITAAQLDVMKKHLVDNLTKHYREFLQNIGNLPGHPHAKQEALRFFDTGFLWYKDSINNMPINPVNPRGNSPKPDAEPQSNEAQAVTPAPEAPEVDVPPAA